MASPYDIERHMALLDEYLKLAEKQRKKAHHDPAIHEQKKRLIDQMLSMTQFDMRNLPS